MCLFACLFLRWKGKMFVKCCDPYLLLLGAGENLAHVS